MRKPVEGLEDQRCTEILNTCEQLYLQKSYSEISIKDIGENISFSRASIYNYYKTKEEIFLGLLTREYERWAIDIQKIAQNTEALSAHELASDIAKTLDKRLILLKISAMNLYEIEDKSSSERLKAYKVSFKKASEALNLCIDRFLPHVAAEKKALVQYGFLPFTYGIYPYIRPTHNQREAMDAVGMSYRTDVTVYEIVYSLLKKLLT